MEETEKNANQIGQMVLIKNLDELKKLSKKTVDFLMASSAATTVNTTTAATATTDTVGATILTLSGDLGAGKTAFTKVLAETLGVEEIVNSPTFIIQKRYKTSHPFFKNLIHIDAYRLNSGDDLINIDWQNTVKNQNTLIVIEWPERVKSTLDQAPGQAKNQAGKITNIDFLFIDEQTRSVKVPFPVQKI